MQRQPILSQRCSRAATAGELRFRINALEPLKRDSRIIALDSRAADVVSDLAQHEWLGSRLLAYLEPVPGPANQRPDARLRAIAGGEVLLGNEVAGADVVVMLATVDADPEAAEIVGDVCAANRVMSAALFIDGTGADRAIEALRPNAMVLALLKDRSDIPDMLTALRA